MEEIVKYLLITSNEAVVPARLALNTEATGLNEKNRDLTGSLYSFFSIYLKVITVLYEINVLIAENIFLTGSDGCGA